jgi:hypothetical protein
MVSQVLCLLVLVLYVTYMYNNIIYECRQIVVGFEVQASHLLGMCSTT